MKKVFFLFCLTLLPCSYVLGAESRAINVLFDVSRSIPQADFEKAKALVQQMVEQAPSTDRIVVYTFGNDLRKVDTSEISNLKADQSNTLLYDAIYDAAQELAGLNADRKSILILSDGVDTKSATVLEDTTTYANNNGIAIYGIGLGKFNRKSLERLAKLTGGQFFDLSNGNLAIDLSTALAAQKEVPKKEPPPVVAAPPLPAARPAAIEPAQPVPERPTETNIPGRRFPVLLIAGGAGALLLLAVVVFIIARTMREEKRKCPTCGRLLESYQTVCPDCSSDETRKERIPADTTQRFNPEGDEEDLIPIDLLEKKPVTEEMLQKTYVLMASPLLVVRRGKNLGQSFPLNLAFPVSIGRSRVNEIRLDDSSISGQHCRIIPENGKHVLYDLESTNGTFVNDKKVKRATLHEGDTIRVGETQFLFKVEQHRN